MNAYYVLLDAGFEIGGFGGLGLFFGVGWFRLDCCRFVDCFDFVVGFGVGGVTFSLGVRFVFDFVYYGWVLVGLLFTGGCVFVFVFGFGLFFGLGVKLFCFVVWVGCDCCCLLGWFVMLFGFCYFLFVGVLL